MPGTFENLTPAAVVAALDRHIVGQERAKRAVAVALRDRWRRSRLNDFFKREVTPKNILMIGPTGVGKTEIARRLADLVNAPFVKVEATKYTEVGYVGRDVEGMIRDLVENAVARVRREETARIQDAVRKRAVNSVVDLLMAEADEFPIGGGAGINPDEIFGAKPWGMDDPPPESENVFGEDRGPENQRASRARLVAEVNAGALDDREVEVIVTERAVGQIEMFSNMGFEQMGVDLGGLLEQLGPTRRKERRMRVADAVAHFQREETEKLLDHEHMVREAIHRAEQRGIVFIDEIDKLAVADESRSGPDVSRGGVQRDLLPIIEGCSVNTRHGVVRTEHILFIASGAFHCARPSDLIPELQGRLPIRVELESLGAGEFERILTEPAGALTRQYRALLATEGVELVFEPGGVKRLAAIAEEVNRKTTDIGARRLHTVMERLLEEVSFSAPEMAGRKVRVTGAFVEERLSEIVGQVDVSRSIL